MLAGKDISTTYSSLFKSCLLTLICLLHCTFTCKPLQTPGTLSVHILHSLLTRIKLFSILDFNIFLPDSEQTTDEGKFMLILKIFWAGFFSIKYKTITLSSVQKTINKININLLIILQKGKFVMLFSLHTFYFAY